MTLTIFITGADTGVGKTVPTMLLACILPGRGVRVAALKPLSSGCRNAARRLHAALGGAMTLDEINPKFPRSRCPAVRRKTGKEICLTLVSGGTTL